MDWLSTFLVICLSGTPPPLRIFSTILSRLSSSTRLLIWQPTFITSSLLDKLSLDYSGPIFWNSCPRRLAFSYAWLVKDLSTYYSTGRALLKWSTLPECSWDSLITSTQLVRVSFMSLLTETTQISALPSKDLLPWLSQTFSHWSVTGFMISTRRTMPAVVCSGSGST